MSLIADTLVEICCNSIHSARNAKAGGAYRIELCQALGEGGTTPSAAAIEYCSIDLNLHTRVLIRPRGGNYCYDLSDTLLTMRDIEFAHKLGAIAVVIGFLTKEGDIDVEKTKMAVRAAEGMNVTFHRAFDVCRNPHDALEQIIDCGCNKLLTSGCKPTAMEGCDTLKKLVEQANNRIGIIAASGIVPENVRQIIEKSGVREVHGSCKTICDGETCTDPEQVKRLFYEIEKDRYKDINEI